jgi:hypothetical protein
MLLKPDYFDKYTWWLHRKSKTKFVVVDFWPLYDADLKRTGYEIGILGEDKNKVDWRSEVDLNSLKEQGEIKEL